MNVNKMIALMLAATLPLLAQVSNHHRPDYR